MFVRNHLIWQNCMFPKNPQTGNMWLPWHDILQLGLRRGQSAFWGPTIFWRDLDQIWSVGKCYQSRHQTDVISREIQSKEILQNQKSHLHWSWIWININISRVLWSVDRKWESSELDQQRRIIGRGEGEPSSFLPSCFLETLHLLDPYCDWLKVKYQMLNV